MSLISRKLSACSLLLSRQSRCMSTINTIYSRLDAMGKKNEAAAAILDQNGRHSYGQLVDRSNIVAKALIDEKVFDENVSFLCPNDASYAVAQFGVWKSGNSCVPLCKSHPVKSLDYYLSDSQSRILITTKNYADKVHPLVKDNPNRKLFVLEDILQSSPSEVSVSDENVLDRNALLIYTSGTTGSPKGVVLTHRILSSQVENLLQAWKYSKEDCLLHVLPLHHTHGIINCLLCPLAVGGRVNMLENFDANSVWKHLLADQQSESRINLFMAVPTVYAKLTEFFDKNVDANGNFFGKSFEEVRSICTREIRLMVCGSAALPQPILESWQNISGHFLLERYGMTELGMALTNPLKADQRRVGSVGLPFPNVLARIVKEGTDEILAEGNSTEVKIFGDSSHIAGDLQVKGGNVFKCYFNRPEATAKEFTKDNWFKTGDVATIENGHFKILGRSSVDIIKSGGYKISALDVERILLSHPSIKEVAVMGVEDATWGQKIGAVIILNSKEEQIELQQLRDWAKDLMPSYSLPTMIKVWDELPKNAMGKINKKELVKLAFP